MAMKAGLTYKFNGRHFLTANVSYGTEAPLANNAYLSPRISDFTSEDVEKGQELKSGRVFSADVNYIFSLPSFTGRVSLYQTILTEPTFSITCFMAWTVYIVVLNWVPLISWMTTGALI